MPSKPTRRKPVAGTSRKAGVGRSAAKTGRARTRAEAVPGGMMTSKVTSRAQTTLPRGVREVLGLRPGQRLGYVFDETGIRLVNPSAVAHEDPVIQQFLQFLGRHMESDPAGSMVPFPGALLDRARAVTTRVEIDHDAPIEGAIPL